MGDQAAVASHMLEIPPSFSMYCMLKHFLSLIKPKSHVKSVLGGLEAPRL